MDPPPPMMQPPVPEKKKGTITLFQSKKPIMPDISGITEDVSNVSRRLRILEESFSNMRKALQVTEDNMLNKNKSNSTEIRTITSDISEMKKEMHEVKERIFELVKELQDTAKKGDVKVLEKYINLWNPVKFVTQNEIEQIVREIIDKREKMKNLEQP